MTQYELLQKCTFASREMRRNAIKMAFLSGSNGAHLGAGLSIIEILATLYLGVLKLNVNDNKWSGRDRFILSKGHGTLGFYTVLCAAGIISEEQLFQFEVNGGDFPGQPSKNLDLGIEFSSGSLGLGLSYAIGVALACMRSNLKQNVYVLMGDGELNEGTVWEGAMFASHNKLSNLTAIVDANGLQSDGRTSDILQANYIAVWRSFGWEVSVVEDGHNIQSLYNTFSKKRGSNMPHVVIAKTIKGKGVSFMENNNEWHHNRLNKDQYEMAISELMQKGDKDV